MPIIKSAIKRMKQTAKRNERNVSIKRDIKTAVKSFLAKPSSKGLSAAYSELDTAVKKKLLKKNTVARRKAQLSKVAKDSGVKLTETKKPSVAKKPAVKSSSASKKSNSTNKKPVAKKTASKKVTK